MIELNKKTISKKFDMNSKVYASVCNSCACGHGPNNCNTTCKGCKDKNGNVRSVKSVYIK